MVGRAAAPLSRPLRAALRAALRLDSRPAGRFAPALNGPVPPHWPAGRGPRDSRCLRRGGFAAVPGSAPAARAWGCAARLRRAAPRFAGWESASRRSASPPTSCRPASPSARRVSVGLMASLIPILAAVGCASLRSEFGPSGLPPKAGGRAPKFSTWDAAHRGFAPLLVTGRWGALPFATGLRPCSRLPAGSPRVRPSRLGAGASCRAAARRSLRSLRLAPRSPWRSVATLPPRQAGAAPCWARCARRFPPFEPFGPGG